MADACGAMDVEEVRERVRAITKMARDDPESALAYEDYLYRLVLRAISDGVVNGPELAGAALEAEEIDYERWYA